MKAKVSDFLYFNKNFIKFIYGLIVLNVLFIILESYRELTATYGYFFDIFEYFSIVIFSLEYILRLWVSDLNGGPIRSRFKFATSILGIIDLVAILPFFIPLFLVLDLRVIRLLRLFRLLRIFKLGRYSKSLKTIRGILKDSKTELEITIFIAFVLLIVSSTLMYHIENEVQPDKFENIGQAMWWSVATLTTVGYGDVYPITPIGKLLSSFIALVGIGFVALPTGIISSAFIGKVQQDKKEKKKCQCPNCGTEF